MGGKARKKPKGSSFRFIDLLVIVLCLSGAGLSINLFRLDMYQTINSRNEEPVGTIVIKNNIVQRRMADRVLWDRLFVSSSAYSGDLIRVAALSSATLIINNNQIELSENTLIRIQKAKDGEGPVQIELSQGSLGLATGGEEGTIMLNVMGKLVEAGPGTVLVAAASDDGLSLQVNEGAAVFVDEGKSREIVSGAMISLDSQGAEQLEAAVVVTQPRPNARYLKNVQQALPITFAWQKVNLEPDAVLRLELALDRDFTQNFKMLDGLEAGVQTALNAGLWHWQLFYRDKVLSFGRINVVEAAGPALISPAMGRLFQYQGTPPELRFEWSETQDASSYLFEASETPDFSNPLVRKNVETSYLSGIKFEAGTWYWRVMPVFPSIYEGSAAWSPAASFRIEQVYVPEEPAPRIALPAPALPEPAQPEPVVIPPEIRLTSPDEAATLAGLTALRQQTVFRWDSDGEIKKARFILSRNPDPARRPEVEIANPDRTVRLDRLSEGSWYWTVEAEAAGGVAVKAQPRLVQVLPIPLLPAPAGRVPADGYRIGVKELQTQHSIAFKWAAVQGANAYVFAIYQEAAGGRKLVFRREPENRTSWTLEDLSVLDNGTFIWQVEAVNLGRNNAIEQRGKVGENSFTINIPLPGPVQLEDTRVFYVD